MSPMSSAREQWLYRYRDQVGRPRDELTTPALILDLDKAKWNISAMANKFRDLPTELRPHIKVHKSIELARLQIDAGAIGIACATVWEAVVMAEGGIEDVLIANQVVQRDKIAEVVALARDHKVTLAVDNVGNVEELSRAATVAGSELDLLIEVDVGMGRCGVRSNEDAALLAERIAELPGIRFRGVQGYEGHCMREPDLERRVVLTQLANERLIGAVDHLSRIGHHTEVVSAGGTGTYFITGANPRITEVQAGSYVLMDCFHDSLVPGGFEIALTVLSTVVSRQGNTVVLDGGRKSIGIDFVMPNLVGYPQGEVRYFAEEHCIVDFPGPPPLDLGDTAEVPAGYGPTTVNLYDVFHVIEDGVVVDIWPVSPRGPGRPI
jgi:D-serine deaminase-like pyridoxal phosphate-dependent protein